MKWWLKDSIIKNLSNVDIIWNHFVIFKNHTVFVNSGRLPIIKFWTHVCMYVAVSFFFPKYFFFCQLLTINKIEIKTKQNKKKKISFPVYAKRYITFNLKRNVFCSNWCGGLVSSTSMVRLSSTFKINLKEKKNKIIKRNKMKFKWKKKF